MIIGGKSGYVHEQDYAAIQGIIPNVKFHVIEKVGHWVHAEAPQEFTRVVEDFIDFGR